MDLIERQSGAGRHPWERARAKFVQGVLQRAGALTSARRVLDVGSGDAWLAQQLRPQLTGRCEIVCWDANYTETDRRALSAENAGVAFVTARPDGPFDLVLLLDVLEHVEDDVAMLAAVRSELAAPGAHVLVTVPAWQALFSQRDRHLGHYRRYSNASGRDLVDRSGLRVIADGGLFHTLLPMRAASVLVERLRGSAEGVGVNPVEWRSGRAVTAALTALLRIDASASQHLGRARIRLPGLSYWALCRNDA